MKKQDILLAAIAIAMQMPIPASKALEISREYNADHKAVMVEVLEMISASQIAQQDMQQN